MNIKKRPKKKVTKGTWGVEVDGKEYEVKGKTVEKYNRDGTVRVRKFKSKGEKGSPIKSVKDVDRYRKDRKKTKISF